MQQGCWPAAGVLSRRLDRIPRRARHAGTQEGEARAEGEGAKGQGAEQGGQGSFCRRKRCVDANGPEQMGKKSSVKMGGGEGAELTSPPEAAHSMTFFLSRQAVALGESPEPC